MVAMSLEVLLSYALAASAIFMALVYRGTGTSVSAGVLLVLCALTGIEKVFTRGQTLPAYTVVQMWIVSEVVPTAAIWGASRVEFTKSHPWWLLIVGPAVFFIALTLALTGFAVLRPPR
jgi:hypothetical protein